MPEITPIEFAGLQSVTAQTQKPSLTLAKQSEPQQETKQEAPVEVPETKITAETTPQDSMRIAALIRKEKQLVKRARELQDRERKIQEIQSQYEPWKEASQIATQNKLEAIKKLGITYEDLTQQVLNGGNLPPEVMASQKAVEAARAEIAAYKQEQEALQIQSQKMQYENAIRQIDSEVQALADTNEKFSLVKESGAYHDVTEYIEKEFHKTGKIIPVVEALEKVELEIAEGILHLAKLEKIKSQLFPKEEPKIEVPAPVFQPQQKIQTLTHRTTVAPPTNKPTTASERRQRAIDAFYGKQ